MNNLTAISKMDQPETFEQVKEAIECFSLRKLRMENISRAFRLQLKENRMVRIIYNSDQQTDREVIAAVQEYDQYAIALADDRFIPIRAIKKVTFKLK